MLAISGTKMLNLGFCGALQDLAYKDVLHVDERIKGGNLQNAKRLVFGIILIK